MITNELSTRLFNNTYNETLQLLTKSEHFLKSYTKRKNKQESKMLDLRINCEMTRVTARLTQVMAWLLAQKAALAGEVTMAEACSDKYLITESPFCIENSVNGQLAEYPIPVQELLEESLALYTRVLTLAQQMHDNTTFSDRN